MSEKTPLVSIIMPAYNAGRLITVAISSVQSQTISDWELLVIDDCSKDKTLETAQTIAKEDCRIHVYSNEVNSGVAKTRNKGLDLCRGKYIAFLDSDDTWHPEKLQVQLNKLQQSGADISYTSYAIVNSTGQKQCPDFLVPETVSFDAMLRENVIGCSTVMLTVEIGKRYKFESSFYHEDYVLWLQLLQSGYRAVGVPEVMVDYFYHGDSKAGNKRNAARERWNIYRRFLQLSLVKSSWYFAHYVLAGIRKYRRV